MKTVKRPPADTDVCPNCKQQVTVPKSTRSFICRSCDAVINVMLTEDGTELKVVGRSVEENPTYQSLESEIAALKRELDDLHARYVAEMARDYGRTGPRLRTLGLLVLIVGVVWMVWNPVAGGALAGGGLVVAVAGIAITVSRNRAKNAVSGELSDEMFRVGARRDLLQREAARLKTKV